MRAFITAVPFALLALSLASGAQAANPQTRLTPQEIGALSAEGAVAGTSGLSGVTSTVLFGDPTKAGPYAVRLHVPPNTTIQAHSHRDDRVATVVAGTWAFGYGRVAAPTALKRLPPGSFYTEPAGQSHFARTGKTAVDVIIAGYGPTDTVYVDPANAPHGR